MIQRQRTRCLSLHPTEIKDDKEQGLFLGHTVKIHVNPALIQKGTNGLSSKGDETYHPVSVF